MTDVYILNRLEDLPKCEKYVFIFGEEKNITKLSTAPNISMQLNYYDEDLPVVLILTEQALVPIYEHVLPPNTYIVLLDKKTLRLNNYSAWTYVLNWSLESTFCKNALFVEWFSVISMQVAPNLTVPINMHKNPCYDWEGDSVDVDMTKWLDTASYTLKKNELSAIGLTRRHSIDLLKLNDKRLADLIPYPPIQVVVYDLDSLRTLGFRVSSDLKTENYFMRDTLIALRIVAYEGDVSTMEQFTVSAPSVTYSEEDLHAILTMKDRYPNIMRKLRELNAR